VAVVEPSLQVHADGARLAQAVGNLLQNAAKFTPKGGRVRLSLESDDQRNHAVIRVRDTGVGMAKEVLGRLFQPFSQAHQTLDRSQGGLGLGLSLVKGLLDLHGGTVEAHSDGPGQGAEFTLRLPLHYGGEVREAPAARAPKAAACRVLIIEDHVDAANSLRDVLRLSGHEVQVAHEAKSGLAKARASKPDVILCDIGLPGMDGYDLARAVRSEPLLRSIFLVALTGYALPEDLARARDAGFDEHLAKPPNLEKVEQLLGRRSPPDTGRAR
jgi:two-component system CheB/CheR fusion protein